MHKAYLIILVLFAACTSAENDTTSDTIKDAPHQNVTDTVTTGQIPTVVPGCYQMAVKKDTATLSLTVSDTIVNGQLRYKWFEKDQNNGTLKGVLRDSLIIADYTFNSEGTTSVRQVIFKIDQQRLLEARGVVKEQNGKMIFENTDQVYFDTVFVFTKIPCQ